MITGVSFLCLSLFALIYSTLSLHSSRFHHSARFKSLNFMASTESVIASKGKVIESSIVESSDWKFIDKIYLITTVNNSALSRGFNQRFYQTKQELEKIQLWDRVTVKSFNVDEGDRVRGCYTSHISVLKDIQRELKSLNRYTCLIMEDNLEVTPGMSPKVLDSVAKFTQISNDWDVFHLAYMMYVPGLRFVRMQQTIGDSYAENILQMIAEQGSSVGTSSYLISKSGIEKMLKDYQSNGYQDAIPVVMAKLFPTSRYACFPMVFHRAGKIGSIVNPQLDSFRKVMFNPALYSLWERLMVYSGLQNNQLFPSLLITLLLLTINSLVNVVFSVMQSSSTIEMNPQSLTALLNTPTTSLLTLDGLVVVTTQSLQLLAILFPLAIALWGASLFKPGNTGSGFAKTVKPSE